MEEKAPKFEEKVPTAASASQDATNVSGSATLLQRLRSVLFHPLGLRLLSEFEGKDYPFGDDVKEPKRRSKRHKKNPTPTLATKNVLKDAIYKARKKSKTGKLVETDLTEAVTNNINQNAGRLKAKHQAFFPVQENEIENKPHGNADIILYDKNEGGNGKKTPYALIEFGLIEKNWSAKLYQNYQYLEILTNGRFKDFKFGEANGSFSVKDVMLFVVITTDWSEDGTFAFRIGVFLCSRSIECITDPCRMALLWHQRTDKEEMASEYFGRFLDVAKKFAEWRDNIPTYGLREHTYLSSSCCKCKRNGKDIVLRSYDNRVRSTSRNPEIYLSGFEECEVIWGEKNWERIDESENIDKLKTFQEADSIETTLWKSSERERRKLLIIGIPYHEGRHFAKSPKEFIPIIKHLKTLHAKGYVHGDIRAFNTVFRDKKDGFLIDYDYGGKAGKAKYPIGYQDSLGDGLRKGIERKEITKRHDWYALGQLIFTFHVIDYEENQFEDIDTYLEVCSKNIRLSVQLKNLGKEHSQDPDEEKLIDFLKILPENCITPSGNLEAKLRESDQLDTSTPPEKSSTHSDDGGPADSLDCIKSKKLVATGSPNKNPRRFEGKRTKITNGSHIIGGIHQSVPPCVM